MRKIIYPLLTVLFLSFSSCDELDDITDITFDTTIESSNMTISDPLTKDFMEAYSFDVSTDIDLSSNSQIDKYLDKIKDWDINSMTINIVSVTLPDTEFVAGTSLTISNSMTTASTVFESAYPIEAGVSIDVPEDFIYSVEEILDDKESFKLTLNGGLNNSATVVFNVVMDVTITAETL